MSDWNGYPPDPTQEGWHWLRQGALSPAYWNAQRGIWEQGGIFCGGYGAPEFLLSKHFAAGVQYVAPCLPPATA